jgi:transposase-like protein
MSLAELMQDYSTEDACKRLFMEMRWPDGVKCPRCKSATVYLLKSKPFHWVCKNKDCGGRNGYHFSIITKTVFENTNYPLRTWFQVIYLMSQSKKGISALQIHRQIKSGDYRTAWFMCHRIRAAMKDPEFPTLMGVVEADETDVGGKDKNRHFSKKSRQQRLAGTGAGYGKVGVIGAIAHKGKVVCQMIENTDTRTLDRFVRKVVDKEWVELISSDEHSGYRLLGTGPEALPHEVICHSSGEYVRGVVHTNSIEGFWSLLKRGIVGTYHKVSKTYLPLY